MTPTQLYEMGYADAVNGLASNASHAHDENYFLGYEDGRGDRESGVKATGTRSPFIVDNKYLESPSGYSFTGEKRTPQKGEIYLTKNGNAGVAKSDPKNGRERHMLKATSPCGYHGMCKLNKMHPGHCSHHQVK